MSDHPPVEGQPGRRRWFSIGSMVVSIVVLAAVIAHAFHLFRGFGRIEASQARFSSWIEQVKKDNPSLSMLGMTVSGESNLTGSSSRHVYRLESPTGREITIEADMNSGPFRGPSRVTFSSAGQSVSWPFEDIGRGRKIDLKAELPGAFR